MAGRDRGSGDLDVVGGTVWDEPGERVVLRVRGGRIAAIENATAEPAGIRRLDASGLTILPGAIDNHVHFRDPGLEHKEGWASGSRAALTGGVTSVLEVQNNEPLLVDAERCRTKVAHVAARSLVHFGIYPNLVEQSLPAIAEMRAFASGYKLFMGASTGIGGASDYGLVRDLFRAVAEVDGLVVLHCEEESILARRRRDPALDARDHGSIARPAVAECVSIAAALELARDTRARVHVFHVSTGRGLELIDRARGDGIDASCSTCPHYLFFTEADAERLGNRIKVNPAIHAPEDRDALRRGLADGRIEVFSSDHAPHGADEKARAYADAPAGIPSVELFYPLLLELVRDGVLSLARAVDAVSTAPARVHRLAGRGRLAPGSHADLCLVARESRRLVRGEELAGRSGWSPYDGIELGSWPVATVVEGRVAFDLRRATERFGPSAASFLRDEAPVPGAG